MRLKFEHKVTSFWWNELVFYFDLMEGGTGGQSAEGPV